ncbi:response regulator [Hymenobacter sp. BT664]|uniref:histidine kinase n=1 Tax=Hymenobacter montanus TaxID=2771359 RepID=A0A927BB77_9BACT|nr:PAS domain-containing hybrid sensor histidine kinase/response regulator [Hymenobacter montanus]MBD2767542.1 response regulator [Hymenobacter montanus]
MPDSARSTASSAATARIAELERALREANDRAAATERHLAGLLEQAGPGMLLLAPNGTIKRLNRALGHLLGLGEPRQPWEGQPADVLFAHLQHLAAEPAQYARHLAALRTTQQPMLGELLPLRDGRVLIQDYALLPGQSEGGRNELFTYRLAPQLPQAGPASDMQHNELLQYLPAAVATHDLQGVLLSCNHTFALLLQSPVAELVGRSLTELVPASDPPATVPAYLAQFSLRTAATGLLPVQARDGQLRQLLYNAYRVSRAGQPAHVLFCALDTTERMQVEAELKRAKEKAEASARAKETFLANLSHEIRTPMNGVLGMARQLTKTRLDPGQQELLRIIQASGEHLLSVLNEVLDMTKISSARLELEQVSFNLRESMEEALRPLAVQAADKGIVFHATLLEQNDDVPRVVGDAYRLNQVLINLVSNAIKFTSAGGSVSISGAVTGRTDTHLTALFRLTDTGTGIPADKLEYIFEDFAQAGVDTARRYGGTGLGLGIARALVEQMGGTLTVDSQLGCGSTFQFNVTLPCAAGPETTLLPPPLDTGALRGRRVLVAEDNGINREVVRLLLQGWGVVVDEAEDGPAALALHTERRYDAVLMDIQMPGMSGVEATAQIRQHPDPARAQVPVLALTANAFRSDLDRYLKAGINDCLTKPFKEEEFYRKLVALVYPPETPLYNLAEVHEMADGDQAFVERMVRSFLLHMPPIVHQLQTAAAAGQWTQVAKLAHHIKPNLIQFGIADVEQALQQLMPVPTAGTKAPKGRAAAVQQLVQQVERVLAELPACLVSG